MSGNTATATSRVKLDALKKWIGRPAGGVAIEGDWWAVFLEALAMKGNVTASAAAAGISRQAAYQARDEYPDFGRAWEQAQQAYLDGLEGDLGRQGLEDRGMPAVVAKLAVLKAYRPQYRDDRGVNITVNQAPQQQLNVLLSSHEGRKLLEAMTLRLHGQGAEHDPAPSLPGD